MMRVSSRLGFGGALTLAVLASPATAAQRIAIPPALQQAGILCLGEALRLCPNALAAKDHGVACILTKRRLLSRPCQGIYDQGVSFLHGGDVHIDLRALKAHRPSLPTPAPPAKPPGAPGGG